MISIKINHNSGTPKYKQIIHGIEQLILTGKLKVGDKMPSINFMAEKHILSRDTVEKAYIHLKQSRTISGIKGKGYYVANCKTETELRICLIFNKLSSYKKAIYYHIINELAGRAMVDLYIHHCNPDVFRELIRKTRDKYSFYVVMPHFKKTDNEITELIHNFPDGRLIILDKKLDDIRHKSYGAIYQDFENDLFMVLQQKRDYIAKYKRAYLVFPENREYPYPPEIRRGFIRFCRMNHLSFNIIHEIDLEREIAGNLYIVIEDADLVNLVKMCKLRNLRLGEDLGVISYNDTPLKEILEEGITVISTDFLNMGKAVAEMIRKNQFRIVRNPFLFLKRNSF